MAETATTRPTRTRTAPAAKSTPAKAAPAKKAAAPAAPEKAATERLTLTFKHVGDTKNYAKFEVEAGSGCVGQIYAPLGTTEVKAIAYGPAAS